jgi:hypothetical protein
LIPFSNTWVFLSLASHNTIPYLAPRAGIAISVNGDNQMVETENI